MLRGPDAGPRSCTVLKRRIQVTIPTSSLSPYYFCLPVAGTRRPPPPPHSSLINPQSNYTRPPVLTVFQWRTQHTGIQGMSCTFGFGTPIQSAECEGMTAFDANVNQHAANTSPETLLCNFACTRAPYQPVVNMWRLPPINQLAPLSAMPCTFDNSWVGTPLLFSIIACEEYVLISLGLV